MAGHVGAVGASCSSCWQILARRADKTISSVGVADRTSHTFITGVNPIEEETHSAGLALSSRVDTGCAGMRAGLTDSCDGDESGQALQTEISLTAGNTVCPTRCASPIGQQLHFRDTSRTHC